MGFIVAFPDRFFDEPDWCVPVTTYYSLPTSRGVCDVDIIGELLGMSQAPTFIYVKKNSWWYCLKTKSGLFSNQHPYQQIP